MRWLNAARARLRLLISPRAAESRMEDEMRFHVEMEAERLMRARSLDPHEARRQALVAFGGAERYREELRDGRGLAWLMGMSLDFRLGVRMMRKYPGLTLVGTLAMAFAVAVGTFGFEAIRQVASPTLPFPEGDRIVGIGMWDAADNRTEYVPLRDFARWRGQLETVEELGVFVTFHRNLSTGPDDVASVNSAAVSASAFRVTGVRPQLGRPLIEADEEPGAPAVLVIGHDIWQVRFASDPDVIGRTVRLGDTPATIVGVMPEGFAFPLGQSAWTALRRDIVEYASREGRTMPVFGRLAEGATIEQARAELTAVGARMAADFPETNEHLRPLVMSYASATSGIVEAIAEQWNADGVDRTLSLLRAGLYSTNLLFLLFLALISANVAALVFARTATRESELVVRNALGASRRRLVGQLFVEALVLGAVAAPIGLAIAATALRGIVTVLGSDLPFWFSDTLSVGSVLFGVTLTVIGAAIVGVVPGLRITRGIGSRMRQLGAGGGGLQFGRGSTIAIVSQIAMSIVFVAVSLYAVVRAVQIRGLDVGFPADEYISVVLGMDRPGASQARYETVVAARARFTRSYEELGRRIALDPAVLDVTFAHVLPGEYHERAPLEVDGIEDRIQTATVATDFFNALVIPLLAGRGFQAADVEAGGYVAVVNPSFIHHVLDDRSAIGRHVRFRLGEGPSADWSPPYEIVGVVQEIALTNDPELPHNAGVYLPIVPGRATQLQMVVHVRGDPLSFAPRIRPLAADVDPSLQLARIALLDEVARNDLATYLFAIRALTIATGLAMLLSLAAVYAVMSFAVARRTREIAIRIALGADPRRIVTSTLGRHLGHAALGVLLGVGLIVHVGPDSITMSGLAARGIPSIRVALGIAAFTTIMMLVVLMAAVGPVRRALRIQPALALKGDD
ncbi:MAG: ABC transporter permease [Gemmatimonadota bacterium]